MNPTPAELLTIISLASKACEFDAAIRLGLITEGLVVEATQFQAAVGLVVPILGRLDTENPGVLPVPHDGRSWAKRIQMVEPYEEVYGPDPDGADG